MKIYRVNILKTSQNKITKSFQKLLSQCLLRAFRAVATVRIGKNTEEMS